jgi:hypothetical protein
MTQRGLAEEAVFWSARSTHSWQGVCRNFAFWHRFKE